MDLHAIPKLAAVAALLLTGACETLAWQNPNVPQEQWAADQSDCRVAAYNETGSDRDYAVNLQRNAYDEANESEALRNQARLAQDIADRREDRVFERCMSDKGYAFKPVG